MAKAKASSTKAKAKRPAPSTAKTTAAKASTPKAEVKTAAAKSTRTLSSLRLRQELVLGSLVGELVGTFAIGATAVGIATLSSSSNPLFVGLAIVGIYLALARFSGGHFNPAVTIGLLTLRKVSVIKAAGYVVAQLLGAMLAYVVMSQFVHAYPVDAASGQAAPVMYHITVAAGDHWRSFFAEALGAVFVGFAYAAAALGHKREGEAGATIGVAYFIGLVIALIGSASVLNPAVALTLGGWQFDNWWSILQYVVGPIVGAVVAVWLYRFMDWDVTGDRKA